MSATEATIVRNQPVNWADRRDKPRVRYFAEVHLSSESNFYTGFSNNISEGGIFVATHVLRSHGTLIDIEFSLPDGGPPIRAEGEVRWVCDAAASERPGMGLQFTSLTEDDRRRIEAFVVQRETLFYDD